MVLLKYHIVDSGHNKLIQWVYDISNKYSSVPNRRACTFINFEKKFPPARPYFGLHVYWFWEKIPPARLFHPMWTALFWSAHLLILRKNSPLHGLILVCTFINFEKKILPARLFWPARLMFFKNFPTCTFISSYTSIRYTRVCIRKEFKSFQLLENFKKKC